MLSMLAPGLFDRYESDNEVMFVLHSNDNRYKCNVGRRPMRSDATPEITEWMQNDVFVFFTNGFVCPSICNHKVVLFNVNIVSNRMKW